MEMSENINEIAAALAKAQAKIGNVAKDAKNPHFKADYASLAAVLETCRPILAENGLCVMQPASSEDSGAVTVETMIAHTSGQWVRSRISCRPGKPDAQGIGSVITYMRRYSLASLVGVAQADDDGEGASGRGENSGPKMEPAQRQKPQQERAAPAAAPAVPDRPASIPVPSAGEESDWGAWGGAFKSALASAKSVSEVNAWCDANATQLAGMMRDKPKWHAALVNDIEAARNRFQPQASDTQFDDALPHHMQPGTPDPEALTGKAA